MDSGAASVAEGSAEAIAVTVDTAAVVELATKAGAMASVLRRTPRRGLVVDGTQVMVVTGAAAGMIEGRGVTLNQSGRERDTLAGIDATTTGTVKATATETETAIGTASATGTEAEETTMGARDTTRTTRTTTLGPREDTEQADLLNSLPLSHGLLVGISCLQPSHLRQWVRQSKTTTRCQSEDIGSYSHSRPLLNRLLLDIHSVKIRWFDER